MEKTNSVHFIMRMKQKGKINFNKRKVPQHIKEDQSMRLKSKELTPNVKYNNNKVVNHNAVDRINNSDIVSGRQVRQSLQKENSNISFNLPNNYKLESKK